MTAPAAGKPGMFIVLEGPDYSGKTTQAKLLATRLTAETGRGVDLLREPGGTELGEALRALLKGTTKIDRQTEIFLFLAARVQLLHERIGPALAAGRHVVLDRFETSTIVYQAAARGIPVGEVVALFGRVRATGVQPNLEVRLEVPWIEIEGRMGARTSEAADPRFENLEFMKRVHEEYQFAGDKTYSSHYDGYVTPWPVHVLCPDPDTPSDGVAEAVWQAVARAMEKAPE